MATRIHEIVFLARHPDHFREGFTVALTPEEAATIRERLIRGEREGTVVDQVMSDTVEEGISYDALVDVLERGASSPRKGFPLPDPDTTHPYLVIASYKPRFLKKARAFGHTAWMTPDQASYIDAMLKKDDRVDDFQIERLDPNITAAEFLEELDRVGVA